MKFNKWTLGLAAVGAVSLTSVAQAEEKMSAVQSALSSTTISGYVDTSMQWNLGTGNANLPGYAFGGTGKADGFNLNVVQLTIAKALDESEWAAGYRADLWFGPDANTLATGSPTSGDVGFENNDLAIRQAYVALRTPVGNGIDWKMGVFDTILGYETLESGNNPNMTRSYGFTLEPTTQTGVLATYRFADSIAASVGVVNTVGPTINGRANPPKAESFKAYTGSIALTAPSDWGWLAGSSLYSGVLCGFDAAAGGNQTRDNYYVGATVNTPVTGLKAGVSFDYAHMWGNASTASVISGAFGAPVGDQYAWGLYLSYQATEKMSLHGRAESIREQGEVAGSDNEAYAFTGTLQYDLWENVISRAEIRWDHGDQPSYGSAGNLQRNAVMVAANVIYKF